MKIWKICFFRFAVGLSDEDRKLTGLKKIYPVHPFLCPHASVFVFVKTLEQIFHIFICSNHLYNSKDLTYLLLQQALQLPKWDLSCSPLKKQKNTQNPSPEFFNVFVFRVDLKFRFKSDRVSCTIFFFGSRKKSCSHWKLSLVSNPPHSSPIRRGKRFLSSPPCTMRWPY